MYNKYPYTDFHELNLDWFLGQFKELMENWDAQKVDYNQFKLDITNEFNSLSGKFDDLKEAVESFTTFVENYFENLDVQEEINNKLDAMVVDGTMSTLLAPLVSPEIPSAVSQWLTENVDPVGSAVTIDSSLSISGSAADAKITGDVMYGGQAAIGSEVFNYTPIPIASNTIKRRLNPSDGLYSVNVDYKAQIFNVSPGEIYKIVSDDKFQFQSDATIPTSGSTTRVGITYYAGTYIIQVPAGATNLVVSTLFSGSMASVMKAVNKINKIASDLDYIDTVKNRENILQVNKNLYDTMKTGTPVEYFVGKDKTYTTINAALTAWTAAGKPDAIVYVSNGEYNEVVFVEDSNISFIGESRKGTVLRTTSGVYNDAPFRIHHGNVTVANMTVIADHSDDPSMVLDPDTLYGYAFHIDGGNVGGLVHIKNCTAISYQAPAFGMGTIPGSTIMIEDCDAFCYTPAAATKTANNDCILCHLADPDIYSAADDEALTLINVNVYAKETPRNIIFKSSGSTKKLQLTAIGNILVNSTNTLLVSGMNIVDLDSLSRGNNASALNY